MGKTCWVMDCEFTHHSTGLPNVVCICGRELYSGCTFSLWCDQIGQIIPYDIGEDSIVVFYSGVEAELACHLVLFGEPLPTNVVDLMPEYRMAINGRGGCQGLKMLEACARLGVVPRGTPSEKDRLRKRIIKGFPFNDAERKEILLYCMGDVDDECDILRALQNLGQDPLSRGAVWRGQFIKATARMW
jgi:hypothetical protein